ncbi:Uncharacterised protein [Serratia proteamaculans]|uniref:hypothetical protein n=1 Tax=Serratia proteamaculans TaxID=28151 RepID=UPI00217CC1A5|nr:hypothetical protein [Serratia proteamaculans]CAI1558101.1 Uncharacterised protein [Serratia proteamaculans]CAI1672820.1 Uncharacterised protein [Serratia proteamaculans]
MALLRLIILSGSLLVATSTLAASPVQIRFDSACDFSKLSLILKDPLNPDSVQLNVELQPQAAQRLAATTSSNNIGKTLVTVINGIPVNSATLHSELKVTALSIMTDGPTAQKLFPSLLNKNCESSRK